MELREIIDSGILELYVLGQLSPAESAKVEEYLVQYPELHDELKAIEHALFVIGDSVSQPTSPGLKSKILEQASRTNQTTTASSNLRSQIVTLVSLAAMLGALILWFNQRQNNNTLSTELAALQASCDSLQTSSQQQLALFQELNHPNNAILAFEATPNFEATRLYFHTNTQTNKNFIQVLGLPDIAADQTFQLWSLKEGEAPQPLDIFDGQSDLVEVNFVPGTNAYAITIEQSGGSQEPNLEQLIGVVNVSG